MTARDVPSEARGKPPHWENIEPAVAVPAATTVVVTVNVGPRNFVWTHYGFRSDLVGWPAAEMPFKIGITDVSFSQLFQPRRFDVQAATGSGDKAFIELPTSYTFSAMSNISVEFENIGGVAAIPHLVLAGYLE